MKSKYSSEKLIEEILKLDAIEFLGICKIIGVDVYEKDNCEYGKIVVEEIEEATDECAQSTAKMKLEIQPRDFYDIWTDICDTINEMNRTRRRNLGKLVYAATKGKDKED